MTAANVFSRPDAAWLFFDTACFDDAGWITRFEPKVFCSDRLRLAIGLCGRINPNAKGWLQGWLAGQETQRDALEGLPKALAVVQSLLASAPNTEFTGSDCAYGVGFTALLSRASKESARHCQQRCE